MESIDYTSYALQHHEPCSTGPLRLPYQRPPLHLRKFTCAAVEQVIDDLFPRFKDRDLAQIFQNAYPNTLDTTVRWHRAGGPEETAQSFIVTGDINAEWLRDSTNQLAPYQHLAATSQEIKNLILGAINTQTDMVVAAPYANAFQPPSASGLAPAPELWADEVTPSYSSNVVFECKYELDSLANWMALANRYYEVTKDTRFLTDQWFGALSTVLKVLDAQSVPTFDPLTRKLNGNEYTFSRTANSGTETLVLSGLGNPLASGTGLVRSAFRPSDDATIFGFLIPANAMMSVELQRTAAMLQTAIADGSLEQSRREKTQDLVRSLQLRSESIRQGVLKHGIVQHSIFGPIFAYEVDGYGSHVLMDDANIPSLLSLPRLGFVETKNEVYQNTRRFVLSAHNPYYLQGKAFSGIGGPHIGLRNAWPMAVLVQALTSTDDDEILKCLEKVKNVSIFGLINETIDVDTGIRAAKDGEGFTRPWFSWANATFADLILQLAEEKPHLLFSD